MKIAPKIQVKFFFYSKRGSIPRAIFFVWAQSKAGALNFVCFLMAFAMLTDY
jgi:hypothetical protein